MAHSPDERLDSWKEIAAYLKRSVRTARRWEREEGLPVHRHLHRSLASVYAHKSELDAWRSRSSRAPKPASTAPAGTKSIAVLPFRNLSTDPENAYFADGLTDEVTAALSRVRRLRVISPASARAYRATPKGNPAIATELGVRYLLEGSVRRAGERLRVTAQLLDATSGDQLWADTFAGTVGDVFAIQERLARTIAESLELRLTADEVDRLAERPIDNVAAYECYLRARQEGWRWRKDAIDHAVQLLHNGLAIIGDNARLYAALGLAMLQYREAGIDFSDRPLVEAERCAERVLSLEPTSALGLQLRGWIHYARGRVQQAVGDLRASLEIDPNNADTLLLLSNCLLISGRVAQARPLIERLVAIDPLTPVTRCMPAWAGILEGNTAAAIETYRQMFAMDPSNPMARLFYIWVLILNRRGDEVRTLLDGFPPETRETVPARIASFLAAALEGDRRKAAATLNAQVEAAANATEVFPRFLAQGFAMAGMTKPALHWLAVAIERGFINYPFLAEHDPFFLTLRTDPRFARLLDAVRERWEQFEA